MTATTVRVPVFYGHSEAVNIETARKLTRHEAREILAQAPGVKVVDDPLRNQYPMPIDAAGQDLTLVGRIREDFSIDNGLNSGWWRTISARARPPTRCRSPRF